MRRGYPLKNDDRSPRLTPDRPSLAFFPESFSRWDASVVDAGRGALLLRLVVLLGRQVPHTRETPTGPCVGGGLSCPGRTGAREGPRAGPLPR